VQQRGGVRQQPAVLLGEPGATSRRLRTRAPGASSASRAASSRVGVDAEDRAAVVDAEQHGSAASSSATGSSAGARRRRPPRRARPACPRPPRAIADPRGARPATRRRAALGRAVERAAGERVARAARGRSADGDHALDRHAGALGDLLGHLHLAARSRRQSRSLGSVIIFM
jgi:hypothetical protein